MYFNELITLAKSAWACFLKVGIHTIIAIITMYPIVIQTGIDYIVCHFDFILNFTFLKICFSDEIFN